MAKRKTKSKKKIKSPYYTPSTGAGAALNKLKRGDPPARLLHYGHKTDEIPSEARQLIEVAKAIDDAINLLNSLIFGKTAPLNGPIGSVVRDRELRSTIKNLISVRRDIDADIRDQLFEILNKASGTNNNHE